MDDKGNKKVDMFEHYVALAESEGGEKPDEPLMMDAIETLSGEPLPDDEEVVHAAAEKAGTDAHEYEEQIYAMFAGFLTGGRSKGKETGGEDQLAMGEEVELEHFEGSAIPDAVQRRLARKIASDHLAEFPDYYTRLKKMEDEAKGGRE